MREDLKGPINSIEIAENKPENFAEKMAALFNNVLSRTMEIRDNYGQKIANLDANKWKRLKQIPFVRTVATGGEVILGAEPGKKLSSKEILARSAVAMLMSLEDYISIKEGKKSSTENVFKGKVMEVLSSLKDRALKSNSSAKNILSVVHTFLSEDEELTGKIEENIHSFIRTKTS